MTYLTKCGTKFFRDSGLTCAEVIDGTWTPRDECWCGNLTQNSHQHLLELFGAGAGARAPEVWIANPQEGAELTSSSVVHAFARDERGIARVELYLNTWKWFELGGHDYRERDEPYVLRIPTELPDGIVDVEVRAYNDVGVMASSGFISVGKGEPCVSAATCLAGQLCNQGRCFWPPPEVAPGGACEQVQDCLEGGCREHEGEKRCAPFCDPAEEQPCAAGFDCVAGASASFCWPRDAGCCSAAGRNRRPPWLELGLALAVLLLAVRRRARHAPRTAAARTSRFPNLE